VATLVGTTVRTAHNSRPLVHRPVRVARTEVIHLLRPIPGIDATAHTAGFHRWRGGHSCWMTECSMSHTACCEVSPAITSHQRTNSGHRAPALEFAFQTILLHIDEHGEDEASGGAHPCS